MKAKQMKNLYTQTFKNYLENKRFFPSHCSVLRNITQKNSKKVHLRLYHTTSSTVPISK